MHDGIMARKKSRKDLDPPKRVWVDGAQTPCMGRSPYLATHPLTEIGGIRARAMAGVAISCIIKIHKYYVSQFTRCRGQFACMHAYLRLLTL